VEAAVNRLSCLHAAGGFFPDIYDQEVTVGGIVQFVRMFGDEEFLEMTRLGGDDYRQRTATWRKGRAVRLYHRLLRRYREWDHVHGAPSSGAAVDRADLRTPRFSATPGGNQQGQPGRDVEPDEVGGARPASHPMPAHIAAPCSRFTGEPVSGLGPRRLNVRAQCRSLARSPDHPTGVQVAVYRYDSDEEGSHSSSEVLEAFTTPRAHPALDDDVGGGGGDDDDSGEATSGGGGGQVLKRQRSYTALPASKEQAMPPSDAAAPPAAADEAGGDGDDNDAGDDCAEGGHRVLAVGPGRKLRSVHMQHAVASMSTLAALHWRMLHDERQTPHVSPQTARPPVVDHRGGDPVATAADNYSVLQDIGLGAPTYATAREDPDVLEVRGTLRLLAQELRSMQAALGEEEAAIDGSQAPPMVQMSAQIPIPGSPTAAAQ
jgi:hypothetical protein